MWEEKLGETKQHQLISEATEENGGQKLVKRSDEVFGLLIFEKIILKSGHR